MRNVKIWTQAGCAMCEKVKQHFTGEGYEESPVTALLSGEDRNEQAMVQLAMQDMQLPLVMVDGQFVNPREILAGVAAA
jgi:glutaredoxin